MRVAVYARVSTTHQVQTQTIAQQLDRLQAHCQAQGWELPPEAIFRDDGFSGASLHRPGLARLRQHVAASLVDRVLITTPDRLTRNLTHQTLLLEEFRRAGCQLEFLDQPVSANPHDQLVLQIRGAVAEYERSLITERMRRGRQQKLQAGLLLPWSRPPYGYQVDPDHPRDPQGVRRAEPAATLVAELFARYLEPGQSLIGLTKYLSASPFPAPNGQARWNQATVRGILTNPTYTGTVYAGRTASLPARQRQSALAPVGHQPSGHRSTPPSEWMPVAAVPPLISQAIFDQVQAKLTQNQKFAARHNTTHAYLLRALVSCGHCRLACLGRSDPRHGYAYYVCRGKGSPTLSCRDEKCRARFIPAQQLDDLVWQDVCAVLQQPAILAAALERAQTGAWLPQELQARRTVLQQAQQALEHQVERLTAAYLDGILPLAEYKRRRGDLEQRQAGLAQHALQLSAQVEQQQELTGLLTTMTAFCQRVQAGLDSTDFAQRRQVVELLIDRVVVTDGEVEIRYVIPTSPASEDIRFCYLRLDYFHLTARPVQP